MTNENINIPSFGSYGDYSSDNYGVNSLRFDDTQGRSFYFSYKTLVAVRTNKGLIVHQNDWKQTTGKHLNRIDGGSKEAKKKRLSDEDFNKALKEVF